MSATVKTCKCGNEMLDSIDEFGDPREPVCITCWLNPDITENVKSKIENLADDLKENEEEYNQLEGQIEELQYELEELRIIKFQIKKNIAELRKNGDTTVKTSRERLADWVKGKAHFVPEIVNIFGEQPC